MRDTPEKTGMNRRSWLARTGAAVGVMTLAACQRGQTISETCLDDPEDALDFPAHDLMRRGG